MLEDESFLIANKLSGSRSNSNRAIFDLMLDSIYREVENLTRVKKNNFIRKHYGVKKQDRHKEERMFGKHSSTQRFSHRQMP